MHKVLTKLVMHSLFSFDKRILATLYILCVYSVSWHKVSQNSKNNVKSESKSESKVNRIFMRFSHTSKARFSHFYSNRAFEYNSVH